MVRNLLALAGLAAIALISAIALQAYGYFDDEDGLPPPRIAVSYTGLDLTDPEGVAILERRVNSAIAEVCPRDSGRSLREIQHERRCRERAIAMVEPQVERAIAAANARAETRYAAAAPSVPYDDDDSAEADRMLPPYPAPVRAAPPPPPVEAAPPARRLVRRITTTTVTTTRAGVAAKPTRVVARKWQPAPKRTGRRSTAYARRVGAPGSWLPPAAWTAIERTGVRGFVGGRLTRWSSPGRSGYITYSPARRINGALCRNVRVVKQDGARQVVVAEGTRCRLPSGRLVARDCP